MPRVAIPTTIPDAETLEGLARECEEQAAAIRLRAYRRFEERGGAHGLDMEDWLEAEREVLAELAATLSDDGSAYRLCAESLRVPPPYVHLYATPDRLTVEVAGTCLLVAVGGAVVTTGEHRPGIWQFGFPEAIRPERVTAVVEDGRLEVTLPKANAAGAQM